MKKKIALITGVSGQDGAYLAKFLLDKNYIVVGTDRRSARADNWRLRRLGVENNIIAEELELTEPFEISRLLKKYKFDEIYNLGAQSFVKSSFNRSLIVTSTGRNLAILKAAAISLSPLLPSSRIIATRGLFFDSGGKFNGSIF